MKGPQIEGDDFAGFCKHRRMRTRALPVCFTTQAIGTRVVRNIKDLFPNLRNVGTDIDEPAQSSTGHMVKALVDPLARDGMRGSNALSASDRSYVCGGSAPVGR